MNLQKGFNRIFILLSLAVSLFGLILGREYATESWKPEPEKVFYSINWNKENIRKYYEYAKTISEEERAEIATEKARIAEEEERVKIKQKKCRKSFLYSY